MPAVPVTVPNGSNDLDPSSCAASAPNWATTSSCRSAHANTFDPIAPTANNPSPGSREYRDDPSEANVLPNPEYSIEPHWVLWRLWSFDFNQGLGALLGSVEPPFELGRWEVVEVAV
jgi:hypothetical protein